MKKRVLIILLTMCLSFIFQPSESAFAATAAEAWVYSAIDMDSNTDGNQYFSAGDGTEIAPYEIDTAQELANLAYLINNQTIGYFEDTVYYVLTANIILNDWTDDGDGIAEPNEFSNNSGDALQWTPIGINETICYFSGNFDGDNHTVSGIYINRTGEDVSDENHGLFGVLNGATIKNVGIVNSYIRAYRFAGGISGRMTLGTIQNCYNDAYVTAFQGAGGIVGIGTDGTVTKCFNIGNIVGTTAGFNLQIGGIVGQNLLDISYCYNAGSITGYQNIGGIAGVNAFFGTVEYSFNSGSISSDNLVISRIGSIAGSDYLEPLAVTSCFYDKQMCTLTGIGGTLESTENLDDTVGNTQGCLTNEMLGTNLNTVLGVEANWIFADNLYPRLAGMNLIDAALVSATPVFLYDNSSQSADDYETCTNVTKDFGLGISNNVNWFSSDIDTVNIIDDEALICGSNSGVTLTAVLNDFIKSVRLYEVTKYFSVTYNLNGGIGILPTQSMLAEGSNFTIAPSNEFSRTGYSFDCWSYGIGLYGADSIFNNIANDVLFTAIWKADAPSSAPVLESRTSTTITLSEVSGLEYSIDNGSTWQSSNIFTGLESNTEYNIVSRVAASGNDIESDASPALSVTTNSNKKKKKHKPSHTITVTDTSSRLFSGIDNLVKVEANMKSAFSNSVEVKITDTDESSNSFDLGIGNRTYPFDISLYIKGTDIKTQPNDKYTVTIYLPVPDNLLDMKEQLSIVHRAHDGNVSTIKSQIKQIENIWYIVFEATEFSPYALVVNSTCIYDKLSGVPYYLDSNEKKVFIGFAANERYITPFGVKVSFMNNSKTFFDVDSHWAKDHISFVSEREIFLGTANYTFSPDSGMTRAMFATIVGRLYESSFDKIEVLEDHSFTDCDYDDYYGKYVDWAAKNGIVEGYGNDLFGPSDPITREQMATLLYRFADFLDVLPNNIDAKLNYPDANNISSYAKNAALYCQTTDIIAGSDSDNFAPQSNATRAEIAVIIERFVKNVLDFNTVLN